MEDVYMCGWVPLLFIWNGHNIVNQLYPNKIKSAREKNIYTPFRYRFLRPLPDSWFRGRAPRTEHSHTQLFWFIITKGYKAKLAKRKGIWGKVWRRPGVSFFHSSSEGDILSFSSSKLWQQVWNVTTGDAVYRDTHCLGLLLELVTWTTSTYHRPKFQTSKRKQMLSINHIVFINSLSS